MNQTTIRCVPPLLARRRSRRLFCWNAFLWGIGNGLVSTSLVIYIVYSLVEQVMDEVSIGLAVSWIIAAPRLIGMLRILTPTLIDFAGSRKYFCFAGYLLSPLVLLLLPILVPVFSTWNAKYISLAIWAVGLIWAMYHLIEYFASVALWTWLGDFLSSRVRARFLAQRERWLLSGQMIGMLVAGIYTWCRSADITTTSERVAVYLPPAELGIAFLFLSAIPILFLLDIPWKKTQTLRARIAEFVSPLRASRFLPFVLFGCWIQMANGLTQGPLSVYRIKVLHISMLAGLILFTVTRMGQILLSSTTGRLIDRFGAVPVIIVSLITVSLGPLCYMVSSPDFWEPIIFAAILWSCWIGVNVGLENLMLSLAPSRERSSAIAFYFTAVTASFGISTLVGGHLFDVYGTWYFIVPRFEWYIDYYQIAFFSGWILRSIGVFFLLWAMRNTR